MEPVLTAATYIAATVLLAESVTFLNGMRHRGHHLARLSYAMIAAGSFGLMMGPICADNRVQWSILLVLVGCAGRAVMRRRDGIMWSFVRKMEA